MSISDEEAHHCGTGTWCAKIQNCTHTHSTHLETLGIPVPVLNPMCAHCSSGRGVC